MKKFASLNYKSWWEKVHGNLLENHVQFLVNVVGSTIDALQTNDEEILILNQSPVLKCRVGVPDKVKGPPNEKVQKEKCSTQTHQTSHKRPSQDESSSTRGDHCWKRVRPPPEKSKDNDLHAAEITDNNVSSSRTLTTIKEPSNGNMLEAKP
ncbi:hypothetical protein KY284_030252 [Solanum tuberosum]|nr:hypothetical protein KY284_030252 [Solanum tuberosum]